MLNTVSAQRTPWQHAHQHMLAQIQVPLCWVQNEAVYSHAYRSIFTSWPKNWDHCWRSWYIQIWTFWTYFTYL